MKTFICKECKQQNDRYESTTLCTTCFFKCEKCKTKLIRFKNDFPDSMGKFGSKTGEIKLLPAYDCQECKIIWILRDIKWERIYFPAIKVRPAPSAPKPTPPTPTELDEKKEEIEIKLQQVCEQIDDLEGEKVSLEKDLEQLHKENASTVSPKEVKQMVDKFNDSFKVGRRL